MTREETMKKIEELTNQMEEGKWEIRPVAIVVGGDQTLSDVKYELRKVWVPTYDEKELQAQIDALSDSLVDPVKEAERKQKAQARFIREKKRRYEKELKELENRMEYLKRWLAENA